MALLEKQTYAVFKYPSLQALIVDIACDKALMRGKKRETSKNTSCVMISEREAPKTDLEKVGLRLLRLGAEWAKWSRMRYTYYNYIR